jgi:hypothetical protein
VLAALGGLLEPEKPDAKASQINAQRPPGNPD